MKEITDPRLIKYLLLPLCIFMLLKRGLDKLLVDFIVDPILAYVSPANIWYDIAALLIFGVIITPIIMKFTQGATLSKKWNLVLLTFIIIYIRYRLEENNFEFTSLWIFSFFKLLDFVSLGAIAVLLCQVESKDEVTKKSFSEGFAIDEAIDLQNAPDILNRGRFISELANQIENTNTKEGSFAIGIVAAWGSGKTTFLKSLMSELKLRSFITVEFNAWKSNSSEQIIENLFKQLNESLQPYSFTIDKKIDSYASNLLEDNKNVTMSFMKSFLNLSSASTDKQYDKINNEIKNIRNKIVISIDDLDRLDKKEIYEVIRLIRNTANFANTFFVVAYDRNYILNAIEDINPYQAHNYLEKIFQVEFTIPSISQNVLENELKKRIILFLTDKGKSEYLHICGDQPGDSAYIGENLTLRFIHNIRDIVRFSNSFKLTYQFVKDEVNFIDFYNLELIRFKHPELFSEFYRERERFLTIEGNTKNTEDENLYRLDMIVENGVKTSRSQLRSYLEREKLTYKFSQNEIDEICYAYSTLFPDRDNYYIRRSNTINKHLTVLKPSMFDRYFVLGIESNLSEIEFSKMRELPTDAYISKIAEITVEGEMRVQLSNRFEEIKTFDNREDFEKVIKGIFVFANSRDPDRKGTRGGPEYTGYNYAPLAQVLGDRKNLSYYSSGLAEYKAFVVSLLQTNSAEHTYTNDFLNILLHAGYYQIANILTDKEISDMLYQNFSNALRKSEYFTEDLWWHFRRSELRVETPGMGVTNISYEAHPEAKRDLRKFICSKGLDGLIVFSIGIAPFNKGYVINAAIGEIFKRNEVFVFLLRRYKGPSKYKEEFLRLYEELKSKQYSKTEGVDRSFFKVIPVDEYAVNKS